VRDVVAIDDVLLSGETSQFKQKPRKEIDTPIREECRRT
jgi:hypothetical protein